MVAYRSGKVSSADQLYLVIESARLDTKRCRVSTTPPGAAADSEFCRSGAAFGGAA